MANYSICCFFQRKPFDSVSTLVVECCYQEDRGFQEGRGVEEDQKTKKLLREEYYGDGAALMWQLDTGLIEKIARLIFDHQIGVLSERKKSLYINDYSQHLLQLFFDLSRALQPMQHALVHQKPWGIFLIHASGMRHRVECAAGIVDGEAA